MQRFLEEHMGLRHTPGPWRDEITEVGELIVMRSDGNSIYLGDMETTEAEDHADARLIAAAPEMLMTLKFVQRWLEGAPKSPGTDQLADGIGAVIKKATEP
jgi:hypothetical protein